jgi:hypothetical protein
MNEDGMVLELFCDETVMMVVLELIHELQKFVMV